MVGAGQLFPPCRKCLLLGIQSLLQRLKKAATPSSRNVPLLTARAVHAMICQLKYICSRYGQIDNTIWANLAQLYKHAEQLQYLDTPVKLYPGMISNTSVKCEVGSLLVWYDSGLSALSPAVYPPDSSASCAQYCSTIDIHADISQHSRLSFDLSRPAEPTRINMGATTHPAMRFIGMPTMQAKMEQLMKALKRISFRTTSILAEVMKRK